ncbi:6-hydroxymethylpterin diphosphokinase MptE-like protein [Brevibacillus brevis]|uniref:motility associated factor glycosyltransferase family protein n=1 Tax=Brevibacillus brevis TaxID=1393 RepID=UPI0037C84818
MILTENIQLLKTYFPQVWQQITDKKTNDSLVRLEETRKQVSTVAVHVESGWNYIHSKYDPLGEAERFVSSIQELDPSQHVLFYGVGLGYHIQELLKLHPPLSFSIYEPNLSVLTKFLSVFDLNKWQPNKQLVNMMTETTSDDLKGNLRKFTHFLDKDVKIVILNSYDRIYPESTRKFVEVFRESVNENKEMISNRLIFLKREAVNGLKNLPYMLETPNILHGHNELFRDKPAIIVAAGPSLNDEYENLRKIKEEGLAYIFSVGSAINSLISNGIYPDAAFSYDGSVMNAKVFEKIIDSNITDVPLIFGSTIGYETVEKYPGKLIHFFVRHDSIVDLLIKSKSEKQLLTSERLRTISSVAMSVLHQIGCSPIILVGQNFGYRGEDYYASGISYIDSKTTEEQKETASSVKDVYGNMILSSRGHAEMRLEMEEFIASIQPITIWNATKGGAHIEGTTFMPLEDLISNKLRGHGAIHKAWVDKLEESLDIDETYLRQKYRNLNESCQELGKIFKRFEELLDEMRALTATKNVLLLEKAFNKFDKLFDRLQQNYFNIFVIQRMNSLGFAIVMKLFEEVRYHTEPIDKAEKVVNQFTKYMESCLDDLAAMKEVLKETSDRIFVEKK